MSIPVPAEPVDPPEAVREKAGVERTCSLLLECQKKLRVFNSRLRATRDTISKLPVAVFPEQIAVQKNLTSDRNSQIKRYRPVIVAAEQLARYASGLVENARLPQIDKIELQLRNAELEAELIEAKYLIG